MSESAARSAAPEGSIFPASPEAELHLLRAVMDSIPDLIFVKDREGRHVLHNKAQRDWLGSHHEQVIGRDVRALPMPAEITQAYYDDDLRVLRSGQPVINRLQPFESRDGRRGWFLTTKQPIRDAHGEVVGIVGIARDVTAIQQQAAELAETRARLAGHLDHLFLAILEFDADGRILRWAGRAEQMFGWPAEAVLGRTLDELGFVHPEDSGAMADMFSRLAAGGTGSMQQYRILHRAGGVRHCVWHTSVLFRADGAVRSYLCLAQDISPQVEAVETLRASDRLLTTLIEATNTGYSLLDMHGRILATNEKYIGEFGFHSPAELAGRALLEFVAPYHRALFAAEFNRLLERGEAHNLEVDAIGSGGQVLPFEVNGKVEHTPEGPRIHVFYRDITRRRRAIDERQAIERKLLETQKLESLGVLAGGIAHDFNNLLTGILGNASLAAAVLGPHSPVQHHLDQIEAAAMRAADLCRQMLAYSGKGRFVIGRLDLNTLINETTNLLRISISKRAQIQFALAPNLPPVLADGTQLRQVIMNLVINASEAIGDRDGNILVSTGSMEADGAYLGGTQSAPDLAPGRYVWFEVSDNGAGMTPEVQARIFDPFFTTKFTGRGLGLAAVLGVIRAQQGAVKVYSEPGKGTTFKILLPVAEGVAESPHQGGVAVKPWHTSGRVLVVDDEDTVRVTLDGILRGFGFDVVTAAHGREALDKFDHSPNFRAIILDLTMPILDGEETFQEIRRRHSDVPVFLMSGFHEAEATKRFTGKGLAGFIQKPFSVASVQDKLRAVLDA